MNENEKDLIKRAEHLINTHKGILPKSSIGILKKGLQFAKEKNEFSDLIEFVPMLEKKYGSLTKEKLLKELTKLQKESMELMKKWFSRRPDERKQRKARISNRADSVAREMMLIQDVIKMLESNSNSLAKSNNRKIISRQKTSLLDYI